MSRKKYITFVDEVKPTYPYYFYNYTGIIMEENEYKHFDILLNTIKDNCLKKIGGKNVPLHFTDLIRKKKRFAGINGREESLLWIELFNLFETTNFYVLSGAADQNKYNRLSQHYKVDIECLTFKMLMQNIIRFLYNNNGYTDIIIEKSNDERKLLEEYFRLKIAGSELITNDAYVKLINQFLFESKENNNSGLQLVDFLANPISRLLCGFSQFSLPSLKKNAYFDLLVKKVYDGNEHIMFEYGIKKL